MNPIEQLFCTPEQGQRLKELVPELTSAFMWAQYDNIGPFITDKKAIVDGAFIEYDCTYTPALTLQELRDVARNTVSESWASAFFDHLFDLTAPELAAWVIERLEEVEQ